MTEMKTEKDAKPKTDKPRTCAECGKVTASLIHDCRADTWLCANCRGKHVLEKQAADAAEDAELAAIQEELEDGNEENPGSPDLEIVDNYPVSEIHVDPEIERAVPRPTPEEYVALREDIKLHGIQTPILISAGDAVVIDGHTRLLIAKELEIPAVTVMMQEFASPEEARVQAMILNIKRRHLNTAQIAVIAAQALKIEKEKAAQRREAALVKARKAKKEKETKLADKSPTQSGTEVPPAEPQAQITSKPAELTSQVPQDVKPGVPAEETGKALEITAKKFGIGKTSLQQAELVLDVAKDNPAIQKSLDDAQAGKKSLKSVAKEAKRAKIQDEMKNTPPATPETPGPAPDIRMWWGDGFAALANPGKVSPESVPFIVTSPPYGEDKDKTGTGYVDWAWDQWEVHFRRFVKLARRALSPSGILAIIVGTQQRPSKSGMTEHLPLDSLAIPICREEGLNVIRQVAWTFKAGKVGGKNSLNGRHESVVLLAKGPGYTFNVDAIRVPALTDDPRNPPGDLVNPGDVWYFERVTNSEKDAKGLIHPCAFPRGLVERLIKLCSKPGDLVVDPFAGSGTTIQIASDCGRKAIGIEINKDYKADVRIQMGPTPYAQEDIA